jgi:oxygen-independent coproporphyrinogen-3 oxidase
MRNLYVHVPFCVSKCRYCAFHSETGAGADELRAFVRLLPREIALRGAADARPATVYLGGGTPSILGPGPLRALLDALPRPDDGAEVSVEVNPGDVTPALAAALRAAGATRVSVGAQSFSDRALAWLGRRHSAARVREAFAALRAAGIPSISLDLIAALPGAPPGEFASSLREAVALGPDHVSVYPLSVEPGTPLARAGVAPPPDDEALASVAEAESVLAAAGYARYELSNYARPGSECRHNLAVWRGEDYLGAGPAAHSREGLGRRANAPSFDAWRAALEAGGLPPADVARLDPDDDESERFATRVRLARWRGPDPATPAGRRRAAALDGLARNGLAAPLGGGDWTLTARGREVADAVMAELA